MACIILKRIKTSIATSNPGYEKQEKIKGLITDVK